MIRSSFVVWLALGLAVPGFAQTGATLSGVITQSDSNQPFSGALVVIDELRRETRAGADDPTGSRTSRPGCITSVCGPKATARGEPK